MNRIIISLLLLVFSTNLIGQETEQESSKPIFRFQGDSRKTFVDKKSVNIFGVRGGLLFKNKYELGLGVYSSNLFGILGRAVEKEYFDNSLEQPIGIPAEIGFHYFSIYGEYVAVENDRLKLTVNSQIGLGRVDINFDEQIDKERIREGKSLLEHSVKADVKIVSWFRIMGGVGYRYLIAGESQIKKAFNAPIYIVGFSLDFKKLFKKKDKD